MHLDLQLLGIIEPKFDCYANNFKESSNKFNFIITNSIGQILEQVIRELPKVYTRKFAERLAPIKNKIMSLQTENRRLQSDLVAVTDRLASRGLSLEPSPADFKLDLPNINEPSNQQLTVFSHA
jgi:hypothetical protein